VGSQSVSDGSLAGSRITFSGGAGYPLDLSNKQFSVEAKDGKGVSLPLSVVSCCAGNSIVVEMPPGAHSTTYYIYFYGPVGSTRASYTPYRSNTGNLTLNSSSTVTPGQVTINLTILQTISNPIASIILVSVKSPLHKITANVTNAIIRLTYITFTVNVTAGSYKFMIRGANRYYSISDILSVTIPTNAYSSAQDYSYNGGLFTINASGLSPVSNIRVNGLRGEIVNFDTTTNVATYQLPPMLTPLTQTNYSLGKPARLDLTATTFFSDITINSNVGRSFDGSLSTYYSSKNTSCWIGVNFGTGVGASVNRIRFFTNFDWTNTAKMILGATF
jgi:hypothetical protein